MRLTKRQQKSYQSYMDASRMTIVTLGICKLMVKTAHQPLRTSTDMGGIPIILVQSGATLKNMMVRDSLAEVLGLHLKWDFSGLPSS